MGLAETIAYLNDRAPNAIVNYHDKLSFEFGSCVRDGCAHAEITIAGMQDPRQKPNTYYCDIELQGRDHNEMMTEALRLVLDKAMETIRIQILGGS